MHRLKFSSAILLLMAVTSLYSCKKCELNPSKLDKKESIPLEMNEINNSYIADNGNHFYSGAFESIQDSILFKVKLKSGEKYQLFCTRIGQSFPDIRMQLLNSDMDTISDALAYPHLTELFFTPVKTDDYFIVLSLSESYNQNLRFKLYFEKCKSSDYSFGEYNWEGKGDWEELNSNSIKYNCSESKNIRWLRLRSRVSSTSKISFTVRSESDSIPSIGFAFSKNYELAQWGEFQEKLPELGTYFNFNDSSSFRMMYLTNGASNYIHGSLDLPNINAKSGIKFEIVPIDFHQQVYINGIPINYSISTHSYNRFYLLIEDINQSDIIFDNFKIEEI